MHGQMDGLLEAQEVRGVRRFTGEHLGEDGLLSQASDRGLPQCREKAEVQGLQFLQVPLKVEGDGLSQLLHTRGILIRAVLAVLEAGEILLGIDAEVFQDGCQFIRLRQRPPMGFFRGHIVEIGLQARPDPLMHLDHEL
jgi:hypothetical protein